jgi:hypothetical protein
MANSAAGIVAVAFDAGVETSAEFGGIDGDSGAWITAYVPVALCRNPPLLKHSIQSRRFKWISGGVGLILCSNYMDKVDGGNKDE